jgi:predicted dehydrogenase
MIVYDDVAPQEKIKVFDTRVERPPHYDTFAEFHYAYHYGDVHIPYIKQEEPLKTECQHFLDCIRHGKTPLTSGTRGLGLVRILEAASESLRKSGAPIDVSRGRDGESPTPLTSETGVQRSSLGLLKRKTGATRSARSVKLS